MSCPSCASAVPSHRALDHGAPPEAPPEVRDLIDALLGKDAGNGRIRCPHCAWRPRKFDRWCCRFCDTSWNTFDTRGTCPGCSHVWAHTMCLACHQWGRHEDWYEPGSPGSAPS